MKDTLIPVGHTRGDKDQVRRFNLIEQFNKNLFGNSIPLIITGYFFIRFGFINNLIIVFTPTIDIGPGRGLKIGA